MSLDKKIAQMIIPAFRYAYFDTDANNKGLIEMNDELSAFISECGFGGVVLFSGNIQDSAQTYELISSFKQANKEGDNIPLLICTDQEGGVVTRLRYGTTLIGNTALAALDDDEAVRENYAIIADELKLLGFNCDFAPVADVNSNPHNPIINLRSFSDDPQVVAHDVNVAVDTLKENGIIPCIKHFAGHGDTETDSHTALPMIEKSREELEKLELIPFESAIADGCEMIMVGHIQYPKIDDETVVGKNGEEITLPASLSYKLVQELLRDQLSYDGVVISDAYDMDATSANFSREQMALKAINAGIDIILIPINDRLPVHMYYRELHEYIAMIHRLVDEGLIEEKRIDEAVERILRLKDEYALSDENDPIDESELRAAIGSYEHHLKELQMAQKAVTVIKNDDVLPLKTEKTIVFVPYESQINQVLYTKELLKKDDLEVMCLKDISLKDYDKEIKTLIADYDAFVIVSAMYDEYDINDNTAAIYDRLLEDLKDKEDKKSVLISANLPYDLERYDSDAKLAAYYAFGMRKIIEDYTLDNPEYGANLLGALIDLYEIEKAQGRLPMDVLSIEYIDGRYQIGDKVVYQRAIKSY